jgi:hypothetical protein
MESVPARRRLVEQMRVHQLPEYRVGRVKLQTGQRRGCPDIDVRPEMQTAGRLSPRRAARSRTVHPGRWANRAAASRGFASAFFTPAAHAVGGRRALVPALAVVLGALIGYRLIAGPGIVAALGVDVVMYLLAAALVLRVPDTPMPVRPPLAMGWREVARRRWLRRTLATVVAVNLFAAGPLLTLAPARAGVFGYSLILTAIGGGAVVGSVFSGYLRKGAVVWLSAAAVGPLVLAFGAGLPLAFLAFAVVGAVQPVHDMLLARALRDRLPRAALGPVSAAEEVASLAVLPVGQVLGGLAIDRFGVTSMAWVIVAALASAALSPILHTRRDRADIRSGSPASSASR